MGIMGSLYRAGGINDGLQKETSAAGADNFAFSPEPTLDPRGRGNSVGRGAADPGALARPRHGTGIRPTVRPVRALFGAGASRLAGGSGEIFDRREPKSVIAAAIMSGNGDSQFGLFDELPEADCPADFREKPRRTRTRVVDRIIAAGTEIRSNPPDEIDFLHTVHCQCGLPYRAPANGLRVWERRQGFVTLRVEAGSAMDPRTGKFVELGLPYGAKPRLVMIHLASEAKRKNSPIIDVEDSMTAFARSLGLDTNGPSLRHFRDQLARLAAATVRLGMLKDGNSVQINTPIISAFDLWYPEEPGQKVLWPSHVQLSPAYYDSLKHHSVPLDHRAIGALATSALALDVYFWLAQRLRRVPANRTDRISWSALHEQFSQGNERLNDFRRRFLDSLRRVRGVYSDARFDTDRRGMLLLNSPPPISEI